MRGHLDTLRRSAPSLLDVTLIVLFLLSKAYTSVQPVPTQRGVVPTLFVGLVCPDKLGVSRTHPISNSHSISLGAFLPFRLLSPELGQSVRKPVRKALTYQMYLYQAPGRYCLPSDAIRM